MNDDVPVSGDAGLGRRILLAVGGLCVGIGGMLGFFVGANSGQFMPEFTVLGLVTIPMTPLWVSLYGMIVVAAFLLAFYGAVAFAARFDPEAQ